MKLSIYLLVFGLLSALWGCQEEPGYPQVKVPQQLLQQVAVQQAGHKLFTQLCKECHGSLTEGRSKRAARFEPPAPDFRHPRYASVAAAYLYWRIEIGKQIEPYRSRGSVMPAWGPYLSPEQIWQLVAYLQNRAHIEAQ